MAVLRPAFIALAACLLAGASARAQPQPQPPPAPSPSPTPSAAAQAQEQSSNTLTVINQNHYIRQGNVELRDPERKTAFYADLVEFFEGEHRAVATGNVTLVQGGNQISAERAEFDTKTYLGTFYNASGVATVQPQRQAPPRPGGLALPPMTGQDTVVYFFGETVEKIGPRKYKITSGGFTTCVQPTPRWDMHADTVILNVDHYTLLKNAVMTVKGVPMLYLPVLYYPTKREQRATGFLIPTYGASSLRGQSIHNAFFWAIDRSQDATFAHDWFSKTGQGVGTEYRYNFGAGTDGSVRAYLLDQHATTYVQPDGTTLPVDASRSFDIRGGANQALPGNMRARVNVNYFSSLALSQTFNTNVFDATANQRVFGGNLIGAWGGYSMNATLDHREYFYDQHSSVLSGSSPTVALSRNEHPLLGTDVYFSLGTEYAHLLNESRAFDTSTNLTSSNSLTHDRLDFLPQLRYPFKRWQWLTANSTIAWRDTYYSNVYAIDPESGGVTQSPANESVNRRFFTYQTQLVGPVFNRIWDTPDNHYAEKFKHSIEPFFTVQATTDVKDFDRIIRVDAVDTAGVGGSALTYGVVNRFYAKRKLVPGQPAQSREIFNVEVRQSHYTNQEAARVDPQYQTTFAQGASANPTHFSPVSVNVRAMPTNELNASLSMEFDSRYHSLRTISANGTYSWSQMLSTNVGWSKTGVIPQAGLFNAYQAINSSTTLRTRNNQYGTTYTFNYDFVQHALLQQRITGFYNAQCCGLAFEYQSYNFGFSSYGLPGDHRFFLSFTLAGLGNFSPFNGALGGVPR